MKKLRVYFIIAVILAVLLIGVLIVLYNTPDIRIGISHSQDNSVNIPIISYRSTLGIGMSKKAQEKVNDVVAEFNSIYGKDRDYILMNYSDLSLDADISYDGSKTVIHLYGKGISLDSNKETGIDNTYIINYKLKRENQ